MQLKIQLIPTALHNTNAFNIAGNTLSASVGTAAFIINGVTLHHAFKFPLKRGPYVPLSENVANTMLAELGNPQLLIIDEVNIFLTATNS